MTFPQKMNIKADRYKSFNENILNPIFVFFIFKNHIRILTHTIYNGSECSLLPLLSVRDEVQWFLLDFDYKNETKILIIDASFINNGVGKFLHVLYK